MIKEKEIPNLFKFSVLILGSGNFIQPLLPPLFSLPHDKKDINKYNGGKREHCSGRQKILQANCT
jgi:hypothetical protein